MEKIFWMWLHLKEGIFPSLAMRLLQHFGSVENIYSAVRSDYMEFGIQNAALLRTLGDKSLKRANEELSQAQRLGILVLHYGEAAYPSVLLEIPDPPIILYVRGDASVLGRRNAFCIVGTRHSTVYGMSATLAISEQLARCGMVIVSGVALGIDSAAHKGAVRGGGKTIGIMGCGINVPYPKDNDAVRKSIIENGALISEFPLGTPPLAANFPIRNRLLSAFSLGVAVMEAGERSGALITAKYAAEQGRDVYALPGNISSPMSAGTNQLIQDGAMLLASADAILAEYILRYPEYFELEILEEERAEEEKTGEIYAETEKALQAGKETEREREIYRLMDHTPKHVDELVHLSGLSVSEVLATLTLLQIKGKVKEHSGSRFSR